MNDVSARTLGDDVLAQLPREAAALVAQLLLEAGDDESRALARRIEAKMEFVLTAEPESGDLFGGLPRFRPENRKRPPANPALYKPLDPDAVAAWFRPGGPLSSALPGYEGRPEQVEMAAAVAEAFSEGRHLAVEAGTGVGKTMAYLVPAALWSLANDLPVVVSTNTKNLQEQLFRKDLPAVAALLRAPLRFALVKGRGNYLCLERLRRLLARREAELSQADLPALARAVAWTFLTSSGDLSLFDPGDDPSGGAPFLRERLASNAEDCRGRKCPHWSRCFLQRARNDSLAADLVVTNHAVYFSEPADKPLALPRAAQVVFDEAQNLEEAATAHFAREFAPRDVRDLARRLHVRRRGAARAAPGTGLLPDLERALLSGGGAEDARIEALGFELIGQARDALDAAVESAKPFFAALGALPPPDESALRLDGGVLGGPGWEKVLQPLQRLQDDLYRLSGLLGRLGSVLGPPPPPPGAVVPADSPRPPGAVPEELAAKLDAAESKTRELLETLDFLSSAKDGDWVYWVSAGPAVPAAGRGRNRRPARIGALHAAPVEIAGFLAEGLFRKLDTAVLCSATLTVRGKIDFLAGRLGLDRVEPDRLRECRLGSPFDYERQCLAAVPMFLPPQASGPAGERADSPFVPAFAGLVARLAAAARGRTLVLFTSYRMMDATASRLAEDPEAAGLRLLVQGDGRSRETLTRLFREEDVPSILLGTDSFWEGVDLIGDALRCLVIAKLPFDAVGEPLVAARAERVREKGGDSFRDYSLPSAAIKFRQGFGRLVRHKDDRGAVVVADTRILTKNYGGVFRKSLPVELRPFDSADALLSSAAPFLR